MKYRKLANTGTSVSNLALGAMEFGTKVEESEAFAILDRFVEAGGNLVDTVGIHRRHKDHDGRREHLASDRVVARSQL